MSDDGRKPTRRQPLLGVDNLPNENVEPELCENEHED